MLLFLPVPPLCHRWLLLKVTIQMQWFLDWWPLGRQPAHRFMVPIGSVQIPSLTLLSLAELVQIESQRSKDQASIIFHRVWFSFLAENEKVLTVMWTCIPSMLKCVFLSFCRRKTKAFGEGCWRKNHCVVGQNKEFQWVTTNFKNPIEHAAHHAK